MGWHSRIDRHTLRCGLTMDKQLHTLTVELASEGGKVPYLIHLFPLGRTVAMHGRVFIVDNPEEIIAQSKAIRQTDLPIDFEHQNDDKETRQKGPIAAAGWIKSLVAKPDGIWAVVEWTARASAMIAAREYRYLSPAFYMTKGTENVFAIKGAGLVHTPAMNLVALARANDRDDTLEVMTATACFAVALGLDSDANEADILAAIASSQTPDPARFVSIDIMRDLQVSSAAFTEEKLVGKVESAISGGYITPAMHDWAVGLCRNDPASFDSFIASSTPAWGHFLSTSQLDGKAFPNERRSNELEVQMCRQLGLTPGRLSNETGR